jgi:prephenate dehydrogenase
MAQPDPVHGSGFPGHGVMQVGKVTILGGGLLGGSLALRLGHSAGVGSVALWARRDETVAEAHAAGVPGATGDLAEAVAGCGLLVLATPVGVMAGLVSRAIAAGLPEEVVVTDVGSVKRAPEIWLEPVLGGRTFVGSHPMAGSQRAGIRHARPDLFEGAACIVTGEGRGTGLIEGLWRDVGCRVVRMDAAVHDRLVARVSHLPHVLAAVGAQVALAEPADGALCGGGLRDTTRVAAGAPAMWAEIMLENRDALAGPLRESVERLREVLALLDAADDEGLCRWLEQAKQRRDSLDR